MKFARKAQAANYATLLRGTRTRYATLLFHSLHSFEDFANGTTLLDGTPMIGSARANGISSSEGGSLTGNGATDVDIPPPDLPPLPMPRFVTFILFPKVS